MTTFSVSCPCGCGEVVTATDEGFSATSCEVTACAKRRASGVVSDTMRKSVAYGLCTGLHSVAHKDGLVAFG
jgi:hypothetical protein